MSAPTGRGLWRAAGYRRLWGATTGANLADGITLGAAPLLAAQLTSDPVAVAGVVVAQRLPWFLFTLVSGVVVDRVDRRRVLALANLARAAALAGLALAVGVGWGPPSACPPRSGWPRRAASCSP